MTSRRPVPRQMRTRPERGGVTTRQQVLARRRMALIGLGVAVPLTLGLALFTGSTLLLFVNLFVDVALAAYIAILLQIKQQQQYQRPNHSRESAEEEVRVVRH